MRSLFFVLALLIAAPAFAADGDFVSGGKVPNSTPQKFKLCDGVVSSTNRTCAEFDIVAKVGAPVTGFHVSVEGSLDGCTGATHVSTVNVRDDSGGDSHELFVLNTATTSNFLSGASGYRYIQVVTTGLVACNDYTVYGVFW